MKARKCMICGEKAKVEKHDGKGRMQTYGVCCAGGHFISCNYKTKKRAIQAWNDCQVFVDRYTV